MLYADARKRADEMPMLKAVADEERSLVDRGAVHRKDVDGESGSDDEPEWSDNRR